MGDGFLEPERFRTASNQELAEVCRTYLRTVYTWKPAQYVPYTRELMDALAERLDMTAPIA